MKQYVAYIRATGIFDDSRATKEIVAISEIANQVYVLSWDRKGNSEQECKKAFKKYGNISFYFFHEYIPMGIGIKNIGKLYKWNKWIASKLETLGKIDAVHACNLDSGISAKWYCRKTKTPLVYDIYDYYIDSHSIPGFAKRMIEQLEINIINKAENTIICTEERAEQIKKAHPKKTTVVYNSPDIDSHASCEIVYDYAYCGTLGGGRLINEILDLYDKHSDIKIVFAGSGALEEKVRLLSEKYENFTYLGAIPYSEVLDIERQTKVLSAIYNPHIRNHRLCAPNKFYESLALGKPVIVCEGTGIDDIVEKNQIGEVIHYDAGQFYDKLEKLVSEMDRNNEVHSRCRKLYDNVYSWKIMKNRIRKIYRELNIGNMEADDQQ